MIYPSGLHPVSKSCGLILAKDKVSTLEKIHITLQLWKKGITDFTEEELLPVKDIKIIDDGSAVEITLRNGDKKQVCFD